MYWCSFIIFLAGYMFILVYEMTSKERDAQTGETPFQVGYINKTNN